MDKTHTLDELRSFPIAHTDTGHFLIEDGKLKQEFYSIGIITTVRAGLFFITIDNQRFSTPKQPGFKQGEQVICILRTQYNSSENTLSFLIKGIEKNN